MLLGCSIGIQSGLDLLPIGHRDLDFCIGPATKHSQRFWTPDMGNRYRLTVPETLEAKLTDSDRRYSPP